MKRARGFTIVELLIVIVVIGILAAISIVAYNNVSNKAHDSTIASDAVMIAKGLELYKAENGSYPTAAIQFPSNMKISKTAYSTTQSNVLYCINKVTDRYSIYLVSKSGKRWLVVSGEVREGVSGANPCTAIDATWANDENNGALHGYTTTNNSWASSWPLVQ